MKITVTGACGYIGSHVVKTLKNRGHDVTSIDCVLNVAKNAECKLIDIFDENRNLYQELNTPDVLIHLACKDVPKHNSLWHVDSISKNFNFLKQMIDAGTKHIITVGSMHEVGYYEGKMSEEALENPQTFYGISKIALRKLIETYIKDKNITYQHLRFFYTFGDDEQSSGSIFSNILKLAKNGEPSFPFTDGMNEFDYIEINELAKQIALVAEQSEIQGIINCCSGTPKKIKDKVEEFINKHHLTIRPEYGKFPKRPYDSPCIYGDNTKIQTIIKNANHA